MKLSRTKNKILGGVCGGISKAAKINISIVRILFVILLFFSCGISVIVYMALWIIVPTETLESEKKAINNSLDSKVFDRNTSNDIELNPPSTANKVAKAAISMIVGGILLGIYGADYGDSLGIAEGFTKGSSILRLPFILLFGAIGLISGAGLGLLGALILAFLRKK
jgi:phage shock protein PspC (stress-responsive transcriptional regulator)